MNCSICLSNSGENRISPGIQIYTGKYWLVEHSYPSKIKGWLVLVLREHKKALHELTSDEFEELSRILNKAILILKKELRTEKEYVACFSEKKNFQHIHFHVIPLVNNLPKRYMGPSIFSLGGKNVSDDDIKRICKRFTKYYSAL